MALNVADPLYSGELPELPQGRRTIAHVARDWQAGPQRLSIDAAIQEPAPLSIDVQNSAPQVDEAIAKDRADHMKWALPFLDESVEEYVKQITAGAESDLRNQVAAKIDRQKSILVQESIAEVAKRNPGRPITTQEVDMIRTMVQENKVTDPTDVLEVAYGKQFMSYLDLAYGSKDTSWKQAKQIDPALAKAASVEGSSAIAKSLYFKKMAQDEEAMAKKQGWVPFLWDQAKGAVPGYTGYMMRGQVPNTTTFEGGLQGSNYIEQQKALARLPMDELKKVYPTILARIRESNPGYAAEFARRMHATSRDDEILNNAFDALDATFFGGVAKGLVKGAYNVGRRMLTQDIKATAKSVVKDAVTSEEHPSIAAPAAAGDLEQAAMAKVIQRMDRSAKGVAETPEEAVAELPSILRNDAKQVGQNPGRSGSELAGRIERQTNDFAEDLMDTWTGAVKVQRTPYMEAPGALKYMMDNSKRLWPTIHDNIINIEKAVYDPISNTYSADLVMGAPGAIFWRTMDQAKNWAKINLKGIEPEIAKQGNGYFIRLRKGLDETNDVMRDMTVELTPDLSKNRTSYLGNFLAWIRNPDDVLALDHRLNRKLVAYGPNGLMSIGKERAQLIRELQKGTTKLDPVTDLPIERMSNPLVIKSRFKDWERVLKLARTMESPEDGQPGYFFKTIPEFEEFYQKTIKRLPDQVETQAYFAYKDLVELDRVFRNIAVYRNKKRVGSEVWTPQVLKAGDSNEAFDIPKFDGVQRDNIPGGEATILILGRRAGEERVYDTKQMPIRQRNIYEDNKKQIQEGRKMIVELYSPEERPFEMLPNVGGKRIRYVIMDSMAATREELGFNQVPRRGGGHWEVDYDFYVKQAKVRGENINGIYRDWYEGDLTLMPVETRAMGKDVAVKLDAIRVAIKAGNLDQAKALVAKNFDLEWEEIHGWFKPKVNSEGKITEPARLSLKEPIQVVQRDKMIGDTDNTLSQRYYYENKRTKQRESTFKDGTKEGSLARQYQVQFTGERDAHEIFTMRNVGSRHEPLYKRTDADLVDPIPVMNRALAKISHSMFFDDYKIYSVETWLAQAAKYLKVSPEEIRAAPFHVFHNADTLFRKDVDINILSQLKATRWQIKQLLGEKSTTDAVIDSVLQKVADSIYGRFGHKGMEIVPLDKLYAMRDPFKFVRQVAFTTKLGLYSVPQVIVQSATYSNIYAINPRQAVTATSGAFATWMTKMNRNPEIVQYLDNMLSKVNIPGMGRWKPGEFKESLELMERMSFDIVAGEVSTKDATMSTKVIRGAGREFLDGGESFFRWGEKNTRFGAWHSAYKEFRELHPTGRITERDAQIILERADMLAGNMSKASSSWLHTGILSLPMQFLAYQLRMSELMFGKRLTSAERARLIFAHSMLYGIPVGTLGWTGIPFSDIFRKHAIENGYVVGDSVLESTLTEGVPALLGAMITSEDGWDPRKGTWFNFADRFGIKGLDPLKEPFKADPDYLKVFGGAGIGTVSSILTSGSGLLTWLKVWREQSPDLKFPYTSDDVLDVFKEISSVNNAWRFIAAAHSAKWFSKKEAFLTETTQKQAFFMALTGMAPQEVGDMYTMSWAMKDEQAMQKKAGEIFMREYRRGLEADADSPNQAAKYFQRAFAILDVYIPEDKKDSFIARAHEGYESLVEKLRFEFYINRAKDDPAKTDAYQRIQRMKER